MGKISDQARQAIRDSGFSLYALRRLTGVEPSALSRFLRGQRSVTVDTLDALADTLGLELVQRACKITGKQDCKASSRRRPANRKG